jgi:PAS domain S-box-containing protein
MSARGGSEQLRPVAELCLQPEAPSVAAARRFLRELLREVDRDQWCDVAELALSEVVTNGVLHAHTELIVRIRVLADLLEVEVSDGNPALPTQRRAHEAEATTGRGLELVAALATDCGVRPVAAGKVVWFTVGDSDSGEEPTPEELLHVWDVEGAGDLEAARELDGAHELEAAADHLPSGAGAEPSQTGPVLLQGMPTILWMAAREHHRALLRELLLYVAAHGDEMPTRPDLVLADEARNLIWDALLAEVDRTGSAGAAEPPETVDLRLAVPGELEAAFDAMQEALDVGEQLAVEDLLLVRPALPEIVAVRNWVCEQVAAQRSGAPATPWSGADDSRFLDEVHDRAHPQLPAWDLAAVTGSVRGVVAADDANRILAISEPLARVTGWRPEELVGRRVVALVPPELREAHVAGFSRHLTTGEARVLGRPLELPVLCKDGSRVPCSFLVERPAVGAGRPVYLAWIEPLHETDQDETAQ